MAYREHDCPGCGVPGIAQAKLACPACWRSLPEEMRLRINASWAAIRRSCTTGRNDLHTAHRAAMAEALRWYRDNRTPST